MKSIFSFTFFVIILLTQNVVFAEGSYEDSRTIIQSDANYRDLLHIYFKGTNAELTDEVVSNYIKDFYESDYNNYRQNEFEWPTIFNKHRNELASRINGANLATVYTFQTGASLGNYDFERGGFAINKNMEYLFVTKRGLSIGDGTIYPDVASKGILIFVSNINGFLTMDRNDGNAFINSRTRNGNVDRNVTLHISFSISNFSPNTGIFLIAQSNNSVSARIIKIDVYDGPKKIGELTSAASIGRRTLNGQIGMPNSTDVFHVYDFANVINSETMSQIKQKSDIINREKGIQIVFVTALTSGDLSIEDYSLQLFNTLDISTNGILYLIVISPNRYDWYLRWGGGKVIETIGGQNILNTVRNASNDFSIYRSYDEAIKSVYNALFAMF